MKLVTLPGVPGPSGCAACVADALRRETLPRRASVLDVGSGSGLLAITAAKRGARSVTALDGSRAARLSIRLNARLNGVRVKTLSSNIEAALAGRRFDVIVCGVDGSGHAEVDAPALLDRIVAAAVDGLRPCGFLLVSCPAGRDATFAVSALRAAGVEADVVSSAADTRAQRHGVVVVRARMPARPPRPVWESAGHDVAL